MTSGAAEVLHLKIVTEAEFSDCLANALQIGGFLVSDFHDGTASEFHRKVKSLVPQKKYGGQKGDE